MNYKLPNIELLPDYPQYVAEHDAKHTEVLINGILKNFGIEGEVVDCHTGPVITQFEIKLGKGVSTSKISNMENDIAMCLSAKSVRIVAPIPGKNTIGIEVPNEHRETVHFKNIIKNYDISDMIIPVVLGETVNGNPCVMDLTKAPHLLIAGQTGAGKSVGVNVIISSILAFKTPSEVNLILIDPKQVELTPYQNIPHVIGDVVTQPENATEALNWVVNEMEKRYRILADAGVRSIKNYDDMPYIVVVIDEMADLMMTTGKEVESYIIRIAQKARAVGIHLILTTQRPDVKVITGGIKANLPTRIGYKVATQTDARTIMDTSGCEKLLGNGDMLLQMSGQPAPERIHGAYITDKEIEYLIDTCAAQTETIMSPEDTEEDDTDIREHPKYNKAVELLNGREVSPSFLSRNLNLNYDTSLRIATSINDLR